MVSSKSKQRAAEVKPNSGSKPDSRLETVPPAVTADVRRVMIAEAAYFIAERRGFGVGRELEDWLLAERQVDATLCTKAAPSRAA